MAVSPIKKTNRSSCCCRLEWYLTASPVGQTKRNNFSLLLPVGKKISYNFCCGEVQRILSASVTGEDRGGFPAPAVKREDVFYISGWMGDIRGSMTLLVGRR